MKDLKHKSKRWWQQAISDYDLLPKLIELNKHDTCCFLAQQTAEKALKAFLFSKGEELILTHSIFKLCELASHHDKKFLALRDDVKQLDFYYTEARYPNALDDVIPAEYYIEKDADEAINMVKDIITAIRPYMD